MSDISSKNRPSCETLLAAKFCPLVKLVTPLFWRDWTKFFKSKGIMKEGLSGRRSEKIRKWRREIVAKARHQNKRKKFPSNLPKSSKIWKFLSWNWRLQVVLAAEQLEQVVGIYKSPNDDAHQASLHRNEDSCEWFLSTIQVIKLLQFCVWFLLLGRYRQKVILKENSLPYWVSEGLLYLWKRFGLTGRTWKEGEEEEIEGGLGRGRREVRTCCRNPLCTRSGRRWSGGNSCQ